MANTKLMVPGGEAYCVPFIAAGALANASILAYGGGVARVSGTAAAAGDRVVLQFGCQVKGPKETGVGKGLSQGELVYWDVADDNFTVDDDSAANPIAGIAVEAAADADTTCVVLLRVPPGVVVA